MTLEEKERMMMMMIRKSPEENLQIESITNDPFIFSATLPAWKLYENPFYTNSSSTPQFPTQYQIHPTKTNQQDQNHQPEKRIHRLQLPISTRKISASFWDLTFIKPLMESELELARAKITELKAELERERRARKKAESANKKLVREMSEAKKGKESLEKLCQELAREISSDKAEMDRMRKDMEAERKMLHVAEVLREERVQMKLADAKLALEEKLHELREPFSSSSEGSRLNRPNQPSKQATNHHHYSLNHISSGCGDEVKFSGVLAEKTDCDNLSNIDCAIINAPSSTNSSHQPENPHIRRGIKGFVEFPKVVKAIGSKSSKHFGTKLECQKAQLRTLLLNRTRSSPIASSATN
ncbi:OLC1v1028850C1 [Oldenlandia corymbosa var. corymbosa]|uniref:OLC1v1028850C1 n=1 Tax=Oldenlandia corymbosa var. corymbosa TaxID=529605 RepID=A0AAV1CCN9_OLDCO|nr:OLC1v1028850C1 [Oldenlandia corymbosa var. corymbosa]